MSCDIVSSRICPASFQACGQNSTVVSQDIPSPAPTRGGVTFNCGENEIQARPITLSSVGATPTPATNIPITALSAQAVQGCSQRHEAPKGLGWPVHKPLMQKPRAPVERLPDRDTALDTFPRPCSFCAIHLTCALAISGAGTTRAGIYFPLSQVGHHMPDTVRAPSCLQTAAAATAQQHATEWAASAVRPRPPLCLVTP